MSSSVDIEDVVTVSEGDITVTKQYAPEEFPVPAIRFEIRSDLDEVVMVRLNETIPESFPMDAVGFHPEYHSDQWTAYQDHRVQFTGTVEPNSSLVTVYGIRLDDEFEPSTFLTEPTIDVAQEDEVVESSADDVSDSVEEVVSSEGTNAVKDLLSGDSESVPGLDDDSDGSDEEPAGSSTSGDADSAIELDIDAAAERVAEDAESDEGDSAAEEPDELMDVSTEEPSADTELESNTSDNVSMDSPAASDQPTAASPSPEAVASALAAEIRDGSVAKSDLKAISEALTIDDASGSTEAKLAHLQQRVETVAAYTGALEEFLEAEGAGAQLIDKLSSELTSLRSELDSIAGAVESNEVDIDELKSTVSTTSALVDSHDSTLTALEEQLSSVDSSVTDLDDRTDSIESNVEQVDADVDDLSDTVESLADDLEDVSADVVDIIEWRDQLGSMFTDE